MLSPGKKIAWLCPKCRSPEIVKGMLGMFIPLENMGSCLMCNSYWRWTTRVKVSLKGLSDVEKIRLFTVREQFTHITDVKGLMLCAKPIIT